MQKTKFSRIILLLLFLFPSLLFAQYTLIETEEWVEKKKIRGDWIVQPGLAIEAYTHPGIRFGVDYPFFERQKLVKKTFQHAYDQDGEAMDSLITRLFTKSKVYFFNTHLTSYIHPSNQSGIWLNASIGRRKFWFRNMKTEQAIGLGYLHTVLDGPVFTTDGNGGFTEQKVAHRSAFSAAYSLVLLGKEGWRTDPNAKWGWAFRHHLIAQIPNNAHFLIRFLNEFTLSYRIGNGQTQKK